MWTSAKWGARLTDATDRRSTHRGVGASMLAALLLLFWDAAIFGSYGTTFLFCPLWFLASVLKNANGRPGWGLAAIRIAIPVLTLGLVLTNNSVQDRIAQANAKRIITACEEFHLANGRYPETLNEVVPRYLRSVPRAKYCLIYGDFLYWEADGTATLTWCPVPVFGRWFFDFESRQWRYVE